MNQQSFDSSAQDSLFPIRTQYQTPYAQGNRTTDLNLPSLAQSFESDENNLYIGNGKTGRAGGNNGLKARPAVMQEDYSSILEEEIIGGTGKLTAGGGAGVSDEEDSFPSIVNAAVKVSAPNSAIQRSKLPSNPILDLSNDSTELESRLIQRAEVRGVDQSTDLDDSISPSIQVGGKLPLKATTGSGTGRETKNVTTARGGKALKPKAKESSPHLSLREQELVIDEAKKEIFALKIKIFFYEDRMKKMNPTQINLALQENIELRVEFQTMKTELKRYKKLLIDSQEVIEALSQGSGNQKTNNRREVELERLLKEEREGRARDRAELERRIQDLMRAAKKGKSLETVNEDAEAQIVQLNEYILTQKEQLEELQDDEQGLRNEVIELGDRLAVAHEDIDELKAQLEEGNVTRGNKSGDTTSGGSRKTDELISENTSLRSQLSAQVIMLKTRNDEKETLQDEIELLKGEIESLENELEQLERARERDSSAAGESLSEAEKDALVEENGGLRDQIAASNLLLEQKETEIEELLTDLDNRDEDHRIDLTNKGIEVEDEWREEVEAARTKRDEISENLRERDEEIKELMDRLDEFGDLRQQDADTIEELNAGLVTKDIELDAANEEIEALNEDFNKFGTEINELAAELEEKSAQLAEKDIELKRAEAELGEVDLEFEDKQKMHDSVVNTLKDKLHSTTSRLSELTIQHSTSVTECNFLQSRMEEMALEAGELGEKLNSTTIAKKNFEADLLELNQKYRTEVEERKLDQNEWGRQRRGEEEKWQRIFDEEDLAIQHATKELASAKDLLSIRSADLQKLQDAFNSLQSDSKSLTTDQFLESDRLKRDLARAEEELERLVEENDNKDGALRETELSVATLRAEVKDIREQLASANQARLELSDKLDRTATEKRSLQNDLISARDRVAVAEDQLATDHKALNRTEGQYRDQIGERNTLLLTVYQYMDKVAAPTTDRTPKKAGQEPKPFNNFSVFHDSLISRCKNINQIQSTFQKRVKESESKLADQFGALRREVEAKGRQIDRFEVAVKAAGESQREWRQKVSAKQAELEAAKAHAIDVQSQLNKIRTQLASSETATGAATSIEVNLLTSKAAAAERSLAVARTKLIEAHERAEENQTKVDRVSVKWTKEEEKWHARIRELEIRCKAAEERTKRETQGAKERVAALEESARRLTKEKSDAERRVHQLGEKILNSEKITTQAAAIVAGRR